MAQDVVFLGLASDLVAEPADQYAYRAGGAPCYPGNDVAIPEEELRCDACGAPLSAVVQLHAPLSHLGIEERCIYVFGCTGEECGRKPGSWKAFCCQLPPAQQPPQQQPASSAAAPPQPAPSDSTGFDAWGAGDDDWAAAAATGDSGAADEADAFDLGSLAGALSAAGEQRNARAAAAPAPAQRRSDPGGAEAAVPCCYGPATRQLPEFYFACEPEPAGAGGMSERELAHVQQLLAAYEREEAEGGGAAGPGGAAACSSAPAAAAAEPGFESTAGEPSSWEPEQYEEDSIRGVDAAYPKFAKRLARSPEQCFRYCWEGQLLWPRAKPPAPAPCPSCGQPRVLELQLMPALISMLLEAHGMQGAAQQATTAPAMPHVANWDWATVAVFSCAVSCGPQPGGADGQAAAASWRREQVEVVNEQDCHTV